MLEFSVIKAATIFVVTGIVTFIGASTGGSAMFTVPLCISVGFPIHIAVATTRFSVFFYDWWFLWIFKIQKIDYRLGLLETWTACVDTYCGSNMLLLIPDDLGKKIMGLAMLFLLFMSLLRKKIKKGGKSTSVLKKGAGYFLFFISRV